jgi:thiamine-monophosphate kinase
VDEFEIIRRYFTAGYPLRPDVVLGVGDDGALTRLAPGEELVTVTDTIVAGTHFPASMPGVAVGHRALAINLSDLAAMGAEPRWFTLSVALPEADAGWLADFAQGLARLAGRYDVALIGGDTVRGPLAISVTALGALSAGSATLRSGATAGDAIYLTGCVGDSGWVWQSLAAGAELDAEDPLFRRFAYPEPRVQQGLDLRQLATATIDVSDGLHQDLGRLLAASGVGGEGDAGLLPISPALRERTGTDRARELALTGGDDYELCFTVAKADEAALIQRAVAWDCPVTRIGAVVDAVGLRWQLHGQPIALPDTAFQHF